MKKSLLAVAFAMVAMASSAQIYVGGMLGFSADKAENAKYGTTDFNLNPEVGYVLNESWSIGLPINIGFEKTAYDKLLKKDGTTTWSVAPYARYTFYKNGILSLFADGILGFNGKDDDTNVALSVAPGIALSIAENISLVSRIGSLGWNNQYGNGSYFGLNASSTLGDISLYYTF